MFLSSRPAELARSRGGEATFEPEGPGSCARTKSTCLVLGHFGPRLTWRADVAAAIHGELSSFCRYRWRGVDLDLMSTLPSRCYAFSGCFFTFPPRATHEDLRGEGEYPKWVWYVAHVDSCVFKVEHRLLNMLFFFWKLDLITFFCRGLGSHFCVGLLFVRRYCCMCLPIAMAEYFDYWSVS